MARYIESIHDCSIKAFYDAAEKAEYKGLLIEGKYDEAQAKKAWDKITKEFVNEFGIPPNYKKFIKLRLKSISYKIKYHKNNDKSRLPLAQLKQTEAERQVNSQASQDLKDTVVKVSRFMGRFIDIRKDSIYMFQSCINSMRNG